ncbi:MAG: hypothetical protein LBR53_06515 [Deltaproteobacteria bacterium]|nr:hypothetical protein [Deltaproteobacteria bacterium]
MPPRDGGTIVLAAEVPVPGPSASGERGNGSMAAAFLGWHAGDLHDEENPVARPGGGGGDFDGTYYTEYN